MIKRSLFALALAAALPLSAHAADGISFTNVELDYVHHDIEDLNARGWNLQGSAGFAENWYVFGHIQQSSKNDFDGAGTDFDWKTQGLGVGYHTAISDRAQFLAEVSYRHEEVQLDSGTPGVGGSEGDDGWRGSVGIRGQLSPRFEGDIKLNYTDVNEFGSGVGGEIGALFNINDTWGITARYEHDNRDDFDVNTWKVGVRASF